MRQTRIAVRFCSAAGGDQDPVRIDLTSNGLHDIYGQLGVGKRHVLAEPTNRSLRQQLYIARLWIIGSIPIKNDARVNRAEKG